MKKKTIKVKSVIRKCRKYLSNEAMTYLITIGKIYKKPRKKDDFELMLIYDKKSFREAEEVHNIMVKKNLL